MPNEMIRFRGNATELDQICRIGQILERSGFFNDIRDVDQAVVKCLAGLELGVGPMASMAGIHVIRGKVVLSANLMATCIRRHPDYDFRVREHTDSVCTIEFLRRGEPIGASTFTMEDARRAGLAGGENWRKYPRNMLFARALSSGAKWHCPDVFAGPAYLPDELDAVVDGETGELVSVASPPAMPVGAAMARALEELLRRKGADRDRLLDHYGVGDLAQLGADRYRDAVRALEARPDVQTDPAGSVPVADHFDQDED
ncbi:hypothetical protein [Tautonia plasticadhaerens]|uniref:Uncharacterized protein n=1 Tax=Tautonia plasticadhaerens TaxID=2527974 RepID=A0A518H9M4_9BACT|nr:hypothetical protein [Tautonia plasticadhaerens]QDV37436.1 hypothetical protein ElP_53750 [Tautonia plasticadhaerens]